MKKPHYLYGLVEGKGPFPEAKGLTGLADEPVVLIPKKGLSLLTSSLSPQILEKADPPGLETLALAHHRVLERIFPAHTLLPFRFGRAFFSSRSAALAYLEHQRPTLEKIIAALRGRDEWSLKVYAQVSSASLAPAEKNGGADYLRSRQRVLLEKRQWEGELQCAVKAILEKGAEVTTAKAVFSVGGPESGLCLHVGWLVDRQGQESFIDLLKELEASLAHLRLRFSLNGPLIPYNFASVPLKS